jgi:hypothetical protein
VPEFFTFQFSSEQKRMNTLHDKLHEVLYASQSILFEASWAISHVNMESVSKDLETVSVCIIKGSYNESCGWPYLYPQSNMHSAVPANTREGKAGSQSVSQSSQWSCLSLVLCYNAFDGCPFLITFESSYHEQFRVNLESLSNMSLCRILSLEAFHGA